MLSTVQMPKQGYNDRLRAYLAFAGTHPKHFASAVRDSWLRLDADEIAVIENEVASNYRDAGLDPSWAQVGVYYEDPHIILLRDAVRFSNGRPAIHHRILWKNGPTSGIVVLARLGKKFALVRHYRHPLSAWSWECPRGGSTANQPLEKSVEEELLEEIGAKMLSCRRMGHVIPIGNLLNSGVDTFLADIDRVGQPARSEGIEEIALLSPKEVKQMIAEDLINDAPTICAVAQACFLGYFD
jgi:ADP-ribose pyrophosphatase